VADHLSTLQVKQLCASALPEDELAAAAVHTAECESCHQRFLEEFKGQRGSSPFNFTLAPEFSFRHDHVDFHQLVALADQTLDQETTEIINVHLKTCETCREDVRNFLAYRESSAGEMETYYGPTSYEPSTVLSSAPWWQRLPLQPANAVVAIVLMALAVLIGVIALNRKGDRLEANKANHRNPGIEQSSRLSPSPAPNVGSGSPTVDNSAKVAVLKDAAGEVTIDKSGRVTGIEEVSENTRQYIARAALSERIEPADVLRRLSGEQSGLRGNNDGPQEFRLLYPVRNVVVEDRPVFRWESLPNASSYRVYVLDADGNQLSQSEELPPTKTEWRVESPLRRAQIFSWVVTAVLDEKKVVSPSSSEPEIKFAVLSPADVQELTRLRKSRSRLALGVFYGRLGLSDEAERELQSLIKLNPDTELPRKLLQSVRNMRKGV
jgi:hypothetical protein